jgi:hypothetical protein
LSKLSVKPAKPTNEAIKQDLMVIDELELEPVYDWMHPIMIVTPRASIPYDYGNHMFNRP